MKKILLLSVLLLISFLTMSAQITQNEADVIAKEHMNNETKPFTLYAKEAVQLDGIIIVTSAGETLELDYSCWVYYVSYMDEVNSKYLIVKQNNGNLLEINIKADTGPNNLTEWRIVISYPIEIPFENFSWAEFSCNLENLSYNKAYIFKNNEELKYYISCTNNNYPEIDFLEYDLLLAKGYSAYGIEKIDTIFFKINENKYVLRVILHLDGATVVERWNVSILVSKIPDEASITLEIQEKF